LRSFFSDTRPAPSLRPQSDGADQFHHQGQGLGAALGTVNKHDGLFLSGLISLQYWVSFLSHATGSYIYYYIAGAKIL